MLSGSAMLCFTDSFCIDSSQNNTHMYYAMYYALYYAGEWGFVEIFPSLLDFAKLWDK